MPIRDKYFARIDFPGYGIVGGFSDNTDVHIASPTKYTDPDYATKVLRQWEVEGNRKAAGSSFTVDGRLEPPFPTYTAIGWYQTPRYTLILKYNLNGATSPGSIPNTSGDTSSSESSPNLTVKINSTVPTKTNTNSFAGWATSSTSTSNLKQPSGYISHTFTPNSEDQTYTRNLYAVWEIQQSFNINYPGGSFPSGSAWSNPTKKLVQTGTVNFTIPASGPTRTGYKFLGWSASSTATTPYIKASSASQIVALSQNKVWYAVWKQLWTITYNKGDATSGNTAVVYKDDGVTIQLKDAIFGKTGYTQTGWSKTQGGAKAYNLKANYSADAHLSLYPFWTAKTYTLTYNANGGSNPPAATTNIPYNTSTRVKGIGNMSKNYYKFVVWNTSQGGTGTSFDPNVTITILSDVTLYAIWTKKVANIYYKYKTTTITVYEEKNQGETFQLRSDDPFGESNCKLIAWKDSVTGNYYDTGSYYTIPNTTDRADIYLTPIYIELVQSKYPSYTATENGARVIYVPDYIDEFRSQGGS